MSSDEESVNNEPMVLSENEQLLEQPLNDVLEVDQELQNRDETEEVLKDEGGEDENDEKKTVKPKRTIRNPQPKLNAETLKGPKGIAALESYFQRVKFKGKGNEQQDLDVILKTYEYWCHRLFPKFPFDTCIERLEKLGSKKAVQTHIKRIRFDLLVEDKPIIDDSDEEPNVEGFVNIENNEINQQQNAQFDQLLFTPTPDLNNTPVELTKEQLERIRVNKERAARLKQERLEKMRDKASENLQVSRQLPGTSGLHSETRTKCDNFSQESYVSTLENAPVNAINDSDTLFDHESTVKGKSTITGSSIKKNSSKHSAVLNTFSDSSDDEDMKNTNRTKETEMSTGMVLTTSELLNIEQNSSDTNFNHKKENKGIVDSDESADDMEKYMNKPRSVDIEHTDIHDTVDLIIEEHSSDSDITQKRQNKRNHIIDSDEDQNDEEEYCNKYTSKSANNFDIPGANSHESNQDNGNITQFTTNVEEMETNGNCSNTNSSVAKKNSQNTDDLVKIQVEKEI